MDSWHSVREAAVRGLLGDRYGLPPAVEVTLHRVTENEQTDIFVVRPARARTGRGPVEPTAGPPPLPWVVRVHPTWRRAARTRSDVAALRLLEQRGYPAARVVAALDGAAVSTIGAAGGERTVVVTTYVEGEPTGLRVEGLRALGETLGRLHSLPLDTDDRLWPEGLLPAGMLPRNELAAARAWLEGVRERVPAARQDRFEELEAACRRVDRLSAVALPPVLLHNDCHPWNCVRTAERPVVLIDWDGAGVGPAVIDVGFVLLSADTGGIVGPVIPPAPQRMAALIDGYRDHHTLSEAELAHLPEAIGFRTLVAACGDFTRAVTDGRAEDERPWSWQRYRMADQIAERAQRHFAQAV
jgi:Ser/Thr protein kinase RdoA (MazF antagonist)